MTKEFLQQNNLLPTYNKKRDTIKTECLTEVSNELSNIPHNLFVDKVELVNLFSRSQPMCVLQPIS